MQNLFLFFIFFISFNEFIHILLVYFIIDSTHIKYLIQLISGEWDEIII